MQLQWVTTWLPLSFPSCPSQCVSREIILNYPKNQGFLPQCWGGGHDFGGIVSIKCIVGGLGAFARCLLYPTPELWKIKMSLGVGKCPWVHGGEGKTDVTSINYNFILKRNKAKQSRKQSSLASFTFPYVFKDICPRWHTGAYGCHTSVQLCTHSILNKILYPCLFEQLF